MDHVLWSYWVCIELQGFFFAFSLPTSKSVSVGSSKPVEILGISTILWCRFAFLIFESCGSTISRCCILNVFRIMGSVTCAPNRLAESLAEGMMHCT